MLSDDGSMEYGDFQADWVSLARAERARPLRQKPDCEQVLKSWDFTANASGKAKSAEITPKSATERISAANFEWSRMEIGKRDTSEAFDLGPAGRRSV